MKIYIFVGVSIKDFLCTYVGTQTKWKEWNYVTDNFHLQNIIFLSRLRFSLLRVIIFFLRLRLVCCERELENNEKLIRIILTKFIVLNDLKLLP